MGLGSGVEPWDMPPEPHADYARCGRRWKGHVCVLPTTATTEDSPTGQHEHKCLCGVGWVSRHPYHRSKFSGAGNCWCGRHRVDR